MHSSQCGHQRLHRVRWLQIAKYHRHRGHDLAQRRILVVFPVHTEEFLNHKHLQRMQGSASHPKCVEAAQLSAIHFVVELGGCCAIHIIADNTQRGN